MCPGVGSNYNQKKIKKDLFIFSLKKKTKKTELTQGYPKVIFLVCCYYIFWSGKEGL